MLASNIIKMLHKTIRRVEIRDVRRCVREHCNLERGAGAGAITESILAAESVVSASVGNGWFC